MSLGICRRHLVKVTGLLNIPVTSTGLLAMLTFLESLDFLHTNISLPRSVALGGLLRSRHANLDLLSYLLSAHHTQIQMDLLRDDIMSPWT